MVSPSLSQVIEREMTGLIAISPELLARLESHYSLLCRWNKRLNLTTVTDVEGAALRHYCESLYLSRVLSPGRVVDVGSGAGFPGLVAAVAREDCDFDLVESHQRKAVFLKEASRGVHNVHVTPRRAETVSTSYDWAISRAVRPLDVLGLNLAPKIALLIGEEDAGQLEGFVIDRLPWGAKRVLAVRGARPAQSMP
jgi:16S rRNA (guanine(527)-N(7))-methyltransferase RsmG